MPRSFAICNTEARVIPGSTEFPVGGVHNFGVGGAAAMCDPCAIARIEHGLKCGNQAARRNDYVECFPVTLMHVRFAI